MNSKSPQSPAFQRIKRALAQARAEDDDTLLAAAKIFDELNAELATAGSQSVGDPQVHRLNEQLKRIEAKIDALGQVLAVALEERIAEVEGEVQHAPADSRPPRKE
ncbi:MAG: hypothetical protein NDJ89_18725 [Oligoflexia bacterium]|nr:hypothetical protein [Oligoflexia bacterium]